ncbi:MAG: serine hydrolase [Gammaproteobacteria bacterium]
MHSQHLAAKKPAYQLPQRNGRTGLGFDEGGKIRLHSAFALVQDQSTGKVLYEKRADQAVPIASITKLMTAMVTLDAAPNFNDIMTIGQQDVDTLRHSRSRLPVGTKLSREEMLRLALMSSENRAASALARYYPGGRSAFIKAMNTKALNLGMFDTYFYDSTGLNAGNVSSARDLARMVAAAGKYPLIRQMTSTGSHDVAVGRRTLRYNNTNALVRNPDWHIEVSKTGFINEAGKCLVMKTWIHSKPTIIVLLDSASGSMRIADSMRIRNWLESPAYLTSRDAAESLPGGFE